MIRCLYPECFFEIKNKKTTIQIFRFAAVFLLFARRWSASGTKSKKVAVPLSATEFTKHQKPLPERGNALAELDFFASFCVKTKRRERNYGTYNEALSLIEGNKPKVQNHCFLD